MSGRKVLIIGGGVAGIAAATALADAGLQVTIVEKRPLLGGRASSYLDQETGLRLDECQHGTMRCCTNLDALLRRLGVQDQIRYHDTLLFQDGDGRRSTISGSLLPAPLHTSISFLRFGSLKLADKIAVARAMLAMLRARPGDPRHEALDIAAWFLQMRQTERAVTRFWTPILVSACNEENARISCAAAFKIFRDGFLLNATAYQFGIPRLPLGSLYTESTLRYLEQRGSSARTKTTVRSIAFDGERVAGVVLADGERIEADYYVSALQHDLLLKLLPDRIIESAPYWTNLKQLELSPITGIHLWFDRRIDCPPALAVLDRLTEWIFNKNSNFDLPASSKAYLSAVVSASRRLAGISNDEITAQVLEDVRACIPAARDAVVTRSRVITWPRATLSPLPGVEALRPDQSSPIANLLLAGEWTRTGWPSTMESAARSGFLAAERILQREGKPQSVVAPDMKVGRLARLLGVF